MIYTFDSLRKKSGGLLSLVSSSNIYSEYLEMEPMLEMGLQFEFGPLGTGTKFVPQRQKVRFKHGTRPLILQLAEDSLSVSTLSPYQGWETMRHDVLAA